MTGDLLLSFKNYIQRVLKPIGWNPTPEQLQDFIDDYAACKPENESDAFKVFSRHFPGLLYVDLQGLDNSDYRALLSLAIANAKPKTK